MLEPFRHLDQTLAEIVVGVGQRQGRESRLVRSERERRGRTAEGKTACAAVEAAQDRLAEALEIVERGRGFALEAPREPAHLVVEAIKGRAIVRSDGRAGGTGRKRQLVEPPLQVVERLAIAALGVLDLLHEAAKQPFDRLLIREVLAPVGPALARSAGLPTCL